MRAVVPRASEASGSRGIRRDLVGLESEHPFAVQPVSAERGQLHQQVEPVDDAGAEPPGQGGEHVFAKVRRLPDGNEVACTSPCRRGSGERGGRC